MPPWEKYAAAKPQQAAGPWTKYAASTAAPTPVEVAPAPGAMDYASQGMSGLNEGIANTLGFPVDAATALMNLGSGGINALTGTNIPMIENPVGGSGTFKQLLSPTIRPESEDLGLQMTRRVGQELGAWAVPGIGLAGKAAKPFQTLAKDATSALASGAGAAVAQQIAPDNPLAEFAGQMIGGMTPGGIVRATSKGPKAPSIDELRSTKNAAYAKVDQSGASFAPTEYDKMLTDLVSEVKSANISPTRHERAYSFIVDMINRRGKSLTLTELDQLRQEVRRDLVVPAYGNPNAAADAFFGDKIVDAIDDMIDTKAAGSADLKAARLAHSRLRKSEMLADALYKAKLQASSAGSGGNINNAIRQQIKSILTNKKRVAAFTAEERSAMENLVKQGKLEELLRLVGKLSPQGNGLSAWLGLGAAASGYGALPAAGLVAKSLADTGTVRKAANLQNMVAGQLRNPQPIAPSAAVMAGQLANQLQQK